MTAIDDKYASLGGSISFLGAPTSPEADTANNGRIREYAGGNIYWQVRTGAHEVHANILDRYLLLGGESGSLGFPITDEMPSPDQRGRYSHFQYGSIFHHPGIGTFDIQGRIVEAWIMLGGENGFMGYPTSNHTLDSSGIALSRFEGGWISWDTNTDVVRRVRCPSHESPNYQIPIYAIRARDENGRRPARITANQVTTWVERANRIFEVAGLEFSYDSQLHQINDTAINSITGINDTNWEVVRDALNGIADRERALVVVFRHGPNSGPTGGGFSWTDYKFVVMPGFSASRYHGRQNINLLAHELGHYFGLPHTHGKVFDDLEHARQDFIARGRNSEAYDGDSRQIHDTPPSPHIISLEDQWNTTTITLAGQPFILARDNVISYYNINAQLDPKTLTRDQIRRVRNISSVRRNDFDLRTTETWSPSAERQVYGVTYDQYRAHYNEIWDSGWRLAHLRPLSTARGIRYTAVWRWGQVPETQQYGASHDQYRQRNQELKQQGWRIHLLQPFNHRNQVRYTAVWRRGRAQEIQRFNISGQALRREYDQLWPQGWRIHLIKPYLLNNQLRYAVVWRRGRYGERQVFGWTYARFRREYDTLWHQGWRLTHLEPLTVNNSVRYTAVWRLIRQPEIQLYDRELRIYRARYDELWPSYWRLHIIAPYVLGGKVLYSAVWRHHSTPSTTICRPSTTP